MTMNGRRSSGASLAAIEEVYRRRFRSFAGIAAALVGDSDAGRDAVQDAFAKAVRTRRSFRGDGPLDAWLLRAVVNTALSARRKRARYAAPDGTHVRTGAPDGRGDDDLRAALALLPERQRVVLFLRYYADLDYRAIGETLGIATGTVAATLNAARCALRRSLEGVGT
jgi:RNA polymerase sigma factor (sigma-70 family)